MKEFSLELSVDRQHLRDAVKGMFAAALPSFVIVY
jgi:hypothetical protein